MKERKKERKKEREEKRRRLVMVMGATISVVVRSRIKKTKICIEMDYFLPFAPLTLNLKKITSPSSTV